MNRKIYLLSTGLLIIVAVLSTMLGGRYILGPVGIFGFGALLNIIFSVGVGALMTYMLCIRFRAVWRNDVDITLTVAAKHASFIQRSGRLLVYGFFVLFPLVLLLAYFGGPVRPEIKFLFFPLLKIFPIGYVLFEMARLIDFESRLRDKN
ncbi:MAG: hypothetical protein ACI9Y1_002034 [Lentisphaeria bacterium]|jgi:hypothetical protein